MVAITLSWWSLPFRRFPGAPSITTWDDGSSADADVAGVCFDRLALSALKRRQSDRRDEAAAVYGTAQSIWSSLPK